MVVSKKTLHKWKQLYDHGDKKRICDQYDLHPKTVQRAFSGEGTAVVITAISKFYTKKERELKESQDRLLNKTE